MKMKKVGMIAGISFLAGAIFFALSFGFLQKTDNDETVLNTPVVRAESAEAGEAALQETPIKITGLNFAPLVKMVKPAVVKVMSESIRERRYNSLMERFFDMPGRGSTKAQKKKLSKAKKNKRKKAKAAKRKNRR